MGGAKIGKSCVMPSRAATSPGGRISSVSDRIIEVAEQVVYLGAGVLLVTAALFALVTTGHGLVTGLDTGALPAATGALDGLLLVFILVELLGAVRATLAERHLVAEPFLIVGIIASIKAIVVSSLDASDAVGTKFDDLMIEVGVLGMVVLVLAAASLLMRRKEREPREG